MIFIIIIIIIIVIIERYYAIAVCYVSLCETNIYKYSCTRKIHVCSHVVHLYLCIHRVEPKVTSNIIWEKKTYIYNQKIWNKKQSKNCRTVYYVKWDEIEGISSSFLLLLFLFSFIMIISMFFIFGA